MAYAGIDHTHQHPKLQELWELMLCYGSDEAARRFCAKHPCVVGGNAGDWKSFFPIPEEGNILELGGGFGFDAGYLAEQAARILSIVPNVANARIIGRHLREKNVPNVEIAVVKNVARLPLPDRSISAIAMEDAAVPGFAISNRNFPSVAAEWKRILSPGGVVFIGLGNPLEQLFGLHFLRSKFHPRSYPESLNRYVKRADGRRQWRRLGLKRTIHRMIQLGFDAPSIFSPLPDEKRCEVVIPVKDPRVAHYFLTRLIRKNSPAARAVIAATTVLANHNLLYAVLPYYFLTFRLAHKKDSGGSANWI